MNFISPHKLLTDFARAALLREQARPQPDPHWLGIFTARVLCPHKDSITERALVAHRTRYTCGTCGVSTVYRSEP